LIIHLDQKDWIGLARRYYGVDPDPENVAKQVVQVSDAEKAIFPLSITHFDETMKRLDSESRQRLAKYMVTVSKGWAILPATRIIEPEIEDACLKALGLQGYDLQKFAIKKGLSQLMGGKAELVWKKPPPPGLNKELLDKIESSETLLMSLEHGFRKGPLREMQKPAETGAQKIERIRRAQSQIRDNELRHRFTLAQYLTSEIGPKIVKFLLDIHINPKAFADKFLKEKTQIIRLFQSMPTSYNVVELSFRRDMLAERNVHPHDLNDIMSLAIALPYSDVVVTERMWHTMIVQDKLDKLRPTRVLTSVQQLGPILRAL
jgi:hypothetical protein